MRRLTSREKRIGTLTGIVILVATIYFGIVRPTKEEAGVLDQKISRDLRLLQKNVRIIQTNQQMEKQFNRFLERFKQTRTNEEVMSSILSEIEQVAQELNLQISNLKSERVKSNTFSNRFSVSLTIDSELNSIVHFLYILQKEPHLFDVEEVSFNKGGRRQEQNIKTRLVLSRVLMP